MGTTPSKGAGPKPAKASSTLRGPAGQVLGPWAGLPAATNNGTYLTTCAPPPVTGATGKWATGVPGVTNEVYATWYGVQTDGVVDIDTWTTNANNIRTYMTKPGGPLTPQWSGLFVHVEPPQAAVPWQGKPANAYAHVYRVAQFIASLPSHWRIGLQATVEADAVWALPAPLSPSYVPPKPIPKPKYTSWGGNLGWWGKWGDGGYTKAPLCNATGGGSSQCLTCGGDPADPSKCVATPGYTCVGSAPAGGKGVACVPKAASSATRAALAACGSQPPWAASAEAADWNPSTAVWCTSLVKGKPARAPTANSTTCWCVEEVDSYQPPVPDSRGALLFDDSKGVSHPPWGSFPHAPSTTPWYGGAGAPAPAAAVGPDGSPYQARTAASYNFNSACPYKLVDGMTTWPQGCPNNLYHLGWYAALLNHLLRSMGSPNRVSMMNWDAEGNGPDGLQCSIFQFLAAIREFGTVEDVLPYTPSSGGPAQPWLLFQNGAAGMQANQATDGGASVPCWDWANVGANLDPEWVPAPAGVAKLSDMAEFVPAPEFYWFNGEDMGAAGPQTPASKGPPATSCGGMLDTLVAAGYLGCPQSKSIKVGFDANCSCRQSVYDTYGRVNDGGVALAGPGGVLEALYTKYCGPPRSTTPSAFGGTAPTFSIEHLGPASSMLTFGRCINSQNFPAGLAGAKPGADTGCAADDKCVPRCGVANFFGNWSEACFAQFLFTFLQRWGGALANPAGIARITVYDLGFVPAAWMPQPFSGAPDMTGVPGASAYPSDQLPSGVVDWLPVCPTSAADLRRYRCGPGNGPSDPAWTVADAGQSGIYLPADLQCYDCKAGCAFAPGVRGGVGPDNRYFPTQAFCQKAGECGSVASVPCGGSAPPGPGPGPGPSPSAPIFHGSSVAPGPGPGPAPSAPIFHGSSVAPGPGPGPGPSPTCPPGTATYNSFFGNEGYWGKYGGHAAVCNATTPCPAGFTCMPGAGGAQGLCAPSSLVASCPTTPPGPAYTPGAPGAAPFCNAAAAKYVGGACTVPNPVLAGPTDCWCVTSVTPAAQGAAPPATGSRPAATPAYEPACARSEGGCAVGNRGLHAW
jgi:hypothetical protein